MKIEHDEVCKACQGTGLYVGMAERDGAAVVCHRCKGSGCYHYSYEYTPFTTKAARNDITRVYLSNPGVVIGTGHGFRLDDFGGMPFNDWAKGRPFPKKSEMRKFSCPRWWSQSTGAFLVTWEECEIGLFSRCSRFPSKEKCWKKFDFENP